jgi:Tfp pilus assembly protein PilF
MTIYHPIGDFLYELFPDAKGQGTAALVEAIRKFYTVGGMGPTVVEKEGVIEVQLDKGRPSPDARQFQKAVGYCEKGEFGAAKPLLEDLAKRNPTNSEVYRILGQISSEEGDQDAAIDYLIDALRWDPKNGYALTMMGNIWAKYKHDIDTAFKYYNQAVAVDPNDHIAVNNIGANLLQLNRVDEAKQFLDQALALNKDYPNTHYGLSVVYARQNDLDAAFDAVIEALKKNRSRDKLYATSVKHAQELAADLIRRQNAAIIVKEFAQELEDRAGKPVQFEPTMDIPTTAKLEVAENHKRPFHVVKFKPDHPEVYHLQMHELEHLRLILEARESGVNKLFVMRKEQRASFIRSLEKDVKRLSRIGYQDESIEKYILGLVDGMNRQVYNAPIDLFIEQRLYDDYPQLRPYQFVSLHQLLNEALQATTHKEAAALSPPEILSKSRTYNLLLALQFAELYGIDRTDAFGATPSESRLAKKFWNEFVEYRLDRQAGEEYELVQHWGQDLRLDGFFELVDEKTYRTTGNGTLDEQITNIEADPLNQFSDNPEREKDQQQFNESAAALGVNMAVAMYMAGAIEYLAKLSSEKVKEIAFEIAMLGTQGIRPDKQGYKLHHIPGETFSGYHLLAYYYVSWKIAHPELLDGLKLPYDKEYAIALSFNSARK